MNPTNASTTSTPPQTGASVPANASPGTGTTAAETPAAVDGHAPAPSGGSGESNLQSQKAAHSEAGAASIKAAVADALKAGRIDQTQAWKILNEEGLTPGDDGKSNVPSEVQMLDQAFPKAQPHEYQFPSGQSGPEQTKFNQEVGHALSEAGIPAGIGNFIIREAGETQRTLLAMSPEMRTIYVRTETARADQFFRSQNLDMKTEMKMANDWLLALEAKRPGVVALLEKSGAKYNAAVNIQIWQAARRGTARTAALTNAKSKKV